MTRGLEAAVAAALLLAPGRAGAQVFFEARLQPSLESWERSESAQGALAGSAVAEYQFGGQRGRVFYGLDAGTYATAGDWSYAEHNAGFSWRLASGGPRVHLGARGTLRRNGLDWAAADYKGALAFANAELGLGAQSKLRFGYSLAGREFTGLPELDHVQHDAFGSLLINLPSRTTLLGEAHLGAKSYGGAVRASQVTWLGRVAQSLADRTGLSVQVSGRLTSGTVPSVLVTTPPAFLDDGVYDDPFASDATSVRAVLKHVLEGGAVLEAEASWQRKDYVATLASDALGVPLLPNARRRDESWRGELRASIPMWAARTGPVAVTLDIGYAFLDRLSNDAFYDNRSHGVLAAVSLKM